MSLEGSLESANAISNLASKIMENQGEVLSSLALYTKASLVLHNVIDATERTVKANNLNQRTTPDIFQILEKVKIQFLALARHVEELNDIFEEQVSNGSIKLEEFGKVGLANSLLYNYALNLGKQAAQDEYM